MPARRAIALASRMEDVAGRAGVSKMTVSRFLRFPDKVGRDTGDRIRRAIRELGFVPNMIASNLASSRTGMIAAIIPTVANSVLAEVLQGLSDHLRANNYVLLIGHTGFSAQVEEELVEAFLSRRPDGLYLTGSLHTPRTASLLAQAGIPVVEGGNLAPAPIDMMAGISNFQAGKAITGHLIAKGYRRIAYVGVADRHNDRIRDRRRGYEAALRAAGRPVEPALMLDTAMTIAAGADAIARLMAAEPEIDAVVAALDFLAAGAVFECRRRGWEVPGRVAIAGFGDLDIAAQIVPRLTTVRVPGRQIGTAAARLLCDRLAGRHVRERSVDLGFEIVERDSA